MTIKISDTGRPGAGKADDMFIKPVSHFQELDEELPEIVTRYMEIYLV